VSYFHCFYIYSISSLYVKSYSNLIDGETPSDPRSFRTKRTRAAAEEELIVEKLRHDMELEEKRFKLEERVQLAGIEHESRRLEIELLREQRLAEENKQRQDLYDTLRKSMDMMQRMMEK
jgi:vacuolar-type H+-ATPase catalytic subunit A/Vma1